MQPEDDNVEVYVYSNHRYRIAGRLPHAALSKMGLEAPGDRVSATPLQLKAYSQQEGWEPYPWE